MRRLVVFLALAVVPLSAQANCAYVRTTYKESSCHTLAVEKESPKDALSPAALPGLEEPAVGPIDELTCSCDYILQGSNPLCDSDRTQEFSQTYPQDPSAPVCPRAKSLCAGVCPKLLR